MIIKIIIFTLAFLILYVYAIALAEIWAERQNIRRCVKKYNELHKGELDESERAE